MSLNAVCIIEDTSVLLSETLDNALRFCDTIFLTSNKSDEDTQRLLSDLATRDQRLKICHMNEVDKQLHNCVYNQYHQSLEADDWWYILKVGEMILDDPREMLRKAVAQGCDSMRVWQTQFCSTELKHTQHGNAPKTNSDEHRVLHCRENWREPRFFRNAPGQKWPEYKTGFVPARCKKVFSESPLSCHYVDQTPGEIKERLVQRKSNPFSFLHVKSNHSVNTRTTEMCKPQLKQGNKLRCSLWHRVNFS